MQSTPARLPTKRELQGASSSSPRSLETNRKWLGSLFASLSFGTTLALTKEECHTDVAAETAVEGSQSGLMRLPDELLIQILSHLPPCHTHILNASLVCQRMRQVSQAPGIWSDLIQRNGYPLVSDLTCEAVLDAPNGKWTSEGWIWASLVAPPADSSGGFFSVHFPTLYRSLRYYRRILGAGAPDHPHVQVIEEHQEPVYTAQISGNNLVTGGRDHHLKLWRIQLPLNANGPSDNINARLIHTVENAHEGSVLSASMDGDLLLSGSSDWTAALWRVSDTEMKRIATFSGHTDVVLDVVFTKSYIVTCSKDTTIRIYSRSDYTFVRALSPHTAPINALACDSTDHIVSASGDGSWVMTDLNGLQLMRYSHTETEQRGGRGLASLIWKGDYIVTGSNDRIRYHSASTGELLGTLRGHADIIRSLDLHSFNDGQVILISGSYDCTILRWDLKSGKILSSDHNEEDQGSDLPVGHTSLILDVQLDRGRLVSASHDHTVRIVTYGSNLPYRSLLL